MAARLKVGYGFSSLDFCLSSLSAHLSISFSLRRHPPLAVDPCRVAMTKKFSDSAAWKKSADLPWRQKAPEMEKFEHAKLKATNQPGQGAVMYVPSAPSENARERRQRMKQDDDFPEIDPRLSYAFRKNFQFLKKVFSLDTLVKPLPPELGRSVARNLGFFTRIFTQFFDPKGIQNAQKSIGLGQEEQIRRVR